MYSQVLQKVNRKYVLNTVKENCQGHIRFEPGAWLLDYTD